MPTTIKNDYFSLVTEILQGKKPKIIKDKKYRVIIAVASKGYPLDYNKAIGEEIKGFGKLLKSRINIYGAGIKIKSGKYFVSGGRLFYVLGEGRNVAQARKIAYNALSLVSMEENNLHYRNDIGYRDLKRFFNAKRQT